MQSGAMMRLVVASLMIVLATTSSCAVAQDSGTPGPTVRQDPVAPESAVGPRPAPEQPDRSAPDVYFVPRRIASDGTGDTTDALQSWLDALPARSIAVFDQSTTREGWTAGTDGANSVYRLKRSLSIDKPVTLWGYGAQLFFDGSGKDVWSGGIHLTGRSAAGSKVLGFEIRGNGNHGGTRRAWSGEEGEVPPGIALIGRVRDVEIADTYIHNMRGDGIYKDAWPDFRPNTTSGGFWIHHNKISRTGRQGIVTNLGGPTDRNDFGWKIEYNMLHDVALYPIDAEDAQSTSEYLRGVFILDNSFERWNWEAFAPFNNRCHAISFTYKAGPDGATRVLGDISDVYIQRNTFGAGEGCMGFGGDDHPAVGDPNGGTIILRDQDPRVVSVPKSNIVITGNVWNVSKPQQRGPFASVADCRDLVVADNGIQGEMDLTTFRCAEVTESGNSVR
jgi:hypothetical protein